MYRGEGAFAQSALIPVARTNSAHCGPSRSIAARNCVGVEHTGTVPIRSSDARKGASAQAVKSHIKSLIDAEGEKILSDDTLVDLLTAKGFDIARRTVAKYREAMGIGSSVQRRGQKKMGR